jgi:hypothetical protein
MSESYRIDIENVEDEEERATLRLIDNLKL